MLASFVHIVCFSINFFFLFLCSLFSWCDLHFGLAGEYNVHHHSAFIIGFDHNLMWDTAIQKVFFFLRWAVVEGGRGLERLKSLLKRPIYWKMFQTTLDVETVWNGNALSAIVVGYEEYHLWHNFVSLMANHLVGCFLLHLLFSRCTEREHEYMGEWRDRVCVLFMRITPRSCCSLVLINIVVVNMLNRRQIQFVEHDNCGWVVVHAGRFKVLELMKW